MARKGKNNPNQGELELEPEEKDPPKPYNQRQEVMDRMARERQEALQEGLEEKPASIDSIPDDREELEAEPAGEVAEVTDEPGKNLSGEENPDIQEQGNKKTGKQKDSPVFEREGKQYIRLRVDGQDTEVPLDDALTKLQKEQAAEHRMWEAHQRNAALDEKQRQLENMAKSLDERFAALQQVQSQNQPSPNGDAGQSTDLDAQVQRLLDGLYEGNEEDAKESFKALLAAQSKSVAPQPVPDTRKFVDEAVGEFERRQKQRELAQALNTFKSEFPDIAGDEVLFDAADKFTIQVAKEHPDWSELDVMREAGKRAMAYSPNREETEKEDPFKARQERKRAAPKPIASLSERARVGEEPQKPMTRAEIIENMRKQRGQAY